ncbi:MAG: TlpA family protein disulfide reductase [Pseudomonadota bacterium]
MIRGFLARLALLACVSLGACQRVDDSPPPELRAPSGGSVQRFAFGTTQGEEVNSDNTRGRVTVLLFVTTFDLASQVAAKRLEQVLRAHRSRIFAAAVVMEAAKYAPLADVFRSSLELSYPVAIADLITVQQSSTFGEVLSVPTTLVLDAQGREVLRKSGSFTVAELETWLARAEHP